MRLTEERLANELREHAAECENCSSMGGCDVARTIEAFFWAEVNRQVDEVREGYRRRDWYDE